MSEGAARVKGMTGLKGVRSLDVVREEVRAERGAQLQHFDSIDTKAGILLGFAGALVALAPGRTTVLVQAGRAVAVVNGWKETEPSR